MENDNKDRNLESIYSKRLRAGKRRTYFFDVRATKGNDYYLTITESRKRFDDNGYDRHKVFLYKEDFNKFLKALNEAVEYVKTDLMPNFDFDAFNHEDLEEGSETKVAYSAPMASPTPPPVAAAPIDEKPIENSNNDEKVVSNDAPKSSEQDSAAHNHEEVDKW